MERLPEPPANDPRLESEREAERMKTWIDSQWQIIGKSPAVLRVMACGPSALAGVIFRALDEMGANIGDIKTACKAVIEIEIPRENLHRADDLNRRANRAPLMTDSGVADAIADIITDLTEFRQWRDQIERQIGKPETAVHGA